MSLASYLGISVIFSALVSAMGGQGGAKLDKILPGILIAIEVVLLLVAKGVFDVPSLTDADARRYGSAVIAIVAFSEFIRRDDKSFPLLAFFAGLTQLLVTLDVVAS